MASPLLTRELTRLAGENHHSKDQMVRLGVMQGWRMLNQRRFRETPPRGLLPQLCCLPLRRGVGGAVVVPGVEV